MLEEILRELYGANSYKWPISAAGIKTGTYTIKGGSLELPFLLDGQYFRIVGSAMNDGVYKYTYGLFLSDEEFNGAVWPLSLPKGLLALCEEITAWAEKNGATGVFQSESFGGYSYTRATNAKGGAVTWRDAFQSRLSAWRKV